MTGLEHGVALRHAGGLALCEPDPFMKKFAVIVHGRNFLIQDQEDKFPGLREFYIHAYPEAETAEEAESTAVGDGAPGACADRSRVASARSGIQPHSVRNAPLRRMSTSSSTGDSRPLASRAGPAAAALPRR